MDKFTVRDVNGAVDVVASAAAYTAALQAWIVENEKDTQQLTELVFKTRNPENQPSTFFC